MFNGPWGQGHDDRDEHTKNERTDQRHGQPAASTNGHRRGPLRHEPAGMPAPPPGLSGWRVGWIRRDVHPLLVKCYLGGLLPWFGVCLAHQAGEAVSCFVDRAAAS